MWAAAHFTFPPFPLLIQYGVLPRRMVPPQGCISSVILTSQADNERYSPYHSSYSPSLERGTDVVRVVRGQNIRGLKVHKGQGREGKGSLSEEKGSEGNELLCDTVCWTHGFTCLLQPVEGNTKTEP